MVKHVAPLKWPKDDKVYEIDGVPTVEGLVLMKLARRTANGIQVSNQGHRLMGERLAALAQHSIETGEWHGASGKHPVKPEQPGV